MLSSIGYYILLLHSRRFHDKTVFDCQYFLPLGMWKNEHQIVNLCLNN